MTDDNSIIEGRPAEARASAEQETLIQQRAGEILAKLAKYRPREIAGIGQHNPYALALIGDSLRDLLAARAALGRGETALEQLVKTWRQQANDNAFEAGQLESGDPDVGKGLLAAELLHICADELAAALAGGAATPSGEPQCVIGKYCRTHDFIHGAEAEELRESIEQLQKQVIGLGRLEDELRRILDEVDARDSAAFVGAEGGAATPPRETK